MSKRDIKPAKAFLIIYSKREGILDETLLDAMDISSDIKGIIFSNIPAGPIFRMRETIRFEGFRMRETIRFEGAASTQSKGGVDGKTKDKTT